MSVRSNSSDTIRYGRSPRLGPNVFSFATTQNNQLLGIDRVHVPATPNDGAKHKVRRIQVSERQADEQNRASAHACQIDPDTTSHSFQTQVLEPANRKLADIDPVLVTPEICDPIDPMPFVEVKNMGIICLSAENSG